MFDLVNESVHLIFHRLPFGGFDGLDQRLKRMSARTVPVRPDTVSRQFEKRLKKLWPGEPLAIDTNTHIVSVFLENGLPRQNAEGL